MACSPSMNDKLYNSLPERWKEFVDMFNLDIVAFYPVEEALRVRFRNSKYNETSGLGYNYIYFDKILRDHFSRMRMYP